MSFAQMLEFYHKKLHHNDDKMHVFRHRNVEGYLPFQRLSFAQKQRMCRIKEKKLNPSQVLVHICYRFVYCFKIFRSLICRREEKLARLKRSVCNLIHIGNNNNNGSFCCRRARGGEAIQLSHEIRYIIHLNGPTH